jgi:DNA polymerase-3 subunit epsilon
MNDRPSTLPAFLDMIAQDNFLVLDTETTSLKRGEICQIAVIESSGQVHLDCLVKTLDPIPPEATAIHGITDAMVADSPTFDLLVKPLRELLQGRDLVVYNAKYDRMMMHQSAERVGVEKTEWKEVAAWWCAMTAYAEFFGEWDGWHGNYRWHSLSKAAQHFGISTNGAHSAYADCCLALAVCRQMLEVHNAQAAQE